MLGGSPMIYWEVVHIIDIWLVWVVLSKFRGFQGAEGEPACGRQAAAPIRKYWGSSCLDFGFWKPGGLEAWRLGGLEAWRLGGLGAWRPGPGLWPASGPTFEKASS